MMIILGVIFFVCSWNFQLVTSIDSEKDINSKELQLLSSSLSHFSSSFLQAAALESNQENIIAAPLSAHILLCLLLYGSNGSTKQELTSALHISSLESCNEYKQLSLLKKSEKADLKIASALFVNTDFKPQKDFLLQSKNIFGVEIENIEPANIVNNVEKINKWIERETNEKISHIITNDDVNEYTKAILANALYLKTSWLNQFDSQLTERKPFYNIHGSETKVPIMFQKVYVPHGYIKKLDAQFIKLQYLSNQLEMIIVLPEKKYGLQDLQKRFKWNDLLEASYSTSEVDISLPKFTIESSIDLKSILEKMGVHSIFNQKANFSLISEKPLFLNKFVQKLFIDVNEKGSEAAAATVAQIRSRRMVVDYISFVVDHPFMFAINYKLYGIPLFIGTIGKLGDTFRKDEL